jgi:hypothetical protein
MIRSSSMYGDDLNNGSVEDMSCAGCKSTQARCGAFQLLELHTPPINQIRRLYDYG